MRASVDAFIICWRTQERDIRESKGAPYSSVPTDMLPLQSHLPDLRASGTGNPRVVGHE